MRREFLLIVAILSLVYGCNSGDLNVEEPFFKIELTTEDPDRLNALKRELQQVLEDCELTALLDPTYERSHGQGGYFIHFLSHANNGEQTEAAVMHNGLGSKSISIMMFRSGFYDEEHATGCERLVQESLRWETN